MLVLGIESTAHTFAAAVLNESGVILSDVRNSYRAPSGSGIHPREASRHHADVAPHVIKEAIEKSGISIKDIDAIAYSAGPGLGPCLRVGAIVARTLASYYSKPLTPVNHAVGHIELASLLTSSKDPICILVSGGHTAIVAFSQGRWRFFGETLDITIGQLFDQFGRYVGLSSPCGPVIEELASKGTKYIQVPYTVKGNDMSFSGTLTHSKRLLKSYTLEDVAFSLQETAFAMLCETAERALAFTEKDELLVAGGVAANKRLAEMLEAVCKRQGARLYIPPIKYSGDCGPQIAWTGIRQIQAGITIRPEDAFVRQSWRLDQVITPWRY
ncbi:MAG: KEOPS complex N(6)-L-threonylcarbamoyladenine synthase Kae1 [Conexivisphaerales archaeon]